MTDYYPRLIGQIPAKERLGFYLESYHATGVFPNILLLAAKGAGKTQFARATAGILNQSCMARTGQRKPLIEINCGSISDSEKFITDIIQVFKTGHYTLFLDEIHTLPVEVCDWMLTAIEMGAQSNRVEYGEFEMDWDFNRISLIAATTERQRIFVPLLNRFRELELVDYSNEDLGRILQLNSVIPIDADALDYLVKLGRGNARNVVDIGQEVARYAITRGIKSLSMAGAKELVRILDLFPLGLSRAEVNSLLTLSTRESFSLTVLCSVTGRTRQAQQDSETYLMKHSLMVIDDKSKRVLTETGREYLRALKLIP